MRWSSGAPPVGVRKDSFLTPTNQAGPRAHPDRSGRRSPGTRPTGPAMVTGPLEYCRGGSRLGRSHSIGSRLIDEDAILDLQHGHGHDANRRMWTDVVDLFANGAKAVTDGVVRSSATRLATSAVSCCRSTAVSAGCRPPRANNGRTGVAVATFHPSMRDSDSARTATPSGRLWTIRTRVSGSPRSTRCWRTPPRDRPASPP